MTNMLKGVSLDTFADQLHPLPENLMNDPNAAFDIREALGADTIDALEEEYGGRLNAERLRKLSRRYLERLGFENICRIRADSIFSMSSSMEELFKHDPRHTIFDRIRTSMFHWGGHRPVWNEYVAAYEGLRRFSIDLPDFEARITWTNSACDGNQSEHCDTWLDGHFAYLIHYRGIHVMTLGFSVSGPDSVLVQQVQTTHSRGNRWLFRIPGNRMEFVVDRFAHAFPDHRILVIDGADLVRRNVENFSRTLGQVERCIETMENCGSFSAKRHEGAVAEAKDLADHIDDLRLDVPRLSSFYGDCGRYRRLEPETINRTIHYPLAA